MVHTHTEPVFQEYVPFFKKILSELAGGSLVSHKVAIQRQMYFLKTGIMIIFSQVIYPEYGEVTPDGYTKIDLTPTGLSGDLNHGWFRAKEIFMCYRRGRDKPPLLNVDAMYDGKDKVEPEFQVKPTFYIVREAIPGTSEMQAKLRASWKSAHQELRNEPHLT